MSKQENTTNNVNKMIRYQKPYIIDNDNGTNLRLVVNRREVAFELAEHIKMLCEAKVNDHLSIKEAKAIIDRMALTLSKINEYVIKYDDVKFR